MCAKKKKVQDFAVPPAFWHCWEFPLLFSAVYESEIGVLWDSTILSLLSQGHLKPQTRKPLNTYFLLCSKPPTNPPRRQV